MSIFIHHPGTGTTLNLAECVVLASEPEGSVPGPVPASVAGMLRLRYPEGGRVWLMAVSEGESWDDGTHREVVVLDSGSDHGAVRLLRDGDDVKYRDDVHDLFVDIF
jgi:hypothetical protein